MSRNSKVIRTSLLLTIMGLRSKTDKMTDGDQNFFPVYEPDADVIKQKYREAEEAARAHHYDSTKEGKSPIQQIRSYSNQDYSIADENVQSE